MATIVTRMDSCLHGKWKKSPKVGDHHSSGCTHTVKDLDYVDHPMLCACIHGAWCTNKPTYITYRMEAIWVQLFIELWIVKQHIVLHLCLADSPGQGIYVRYSYTMAGRANTSCQPWCNCNICKTKMSNLSDDHFFLSHKGCTLCSYQLALYISHLT